MVLAWAREGHAATPSEQADALFTKGKAELAEGRVAEACASFEGSLRLDPAVGTELALALCFERQGKLARALATFESLEPKVAKGDRADRAAFVKEHKTRLAATVPTLVFQLGARAPSRVLVDGHEVTTMPRVRVDPGTHAVSAESEQRVFVRETVTVSADGRETIVAIPSAPLPVQADTGPSRAPAWAFLGGGAAATFVAVTAAGLTFSSASDARRVCPDGLCARQEDLQIADRARTEAWVANVATGVATVCFAAAIYFFLRKGDAPKPALTF